MKRRILKLICVLMCILMLISGHVWALDSGKEAAGNKITRVEELIGERTANSKTYLMLRPGLRNGRPPRKRRLRTSRRT